MNAFVFGAMDAAKDGVIGLDAVADYFAAAVGAGRRQGVNCAFKRVKNVSFTCQGNFK
jgi:hypothetical protein